VAVSERKTNVAVSIVIVAFRQRDALLESLEAVTVAAREVPGGAELIVIDNGGLAGLVRERFPAAIVLESPINVGFAPAVNRGIGVASGRWIALVNDDARIEPGALVAALAAGESDARIGSVACQVRFHSAPGVINSAGIELDAIGVASERLAGRPIADAQTGCEVFGATGCFALYRAEMLDRLGGLEGRFFAYFEDVDLAWRARAAGWTATYEPAAIAHHHASASSGEGSAMKYFLAGRNRVWLLARNATGAQVRRALPGILVYDGAYIAYAAVRDRSLAPLAGRIAGLRSWRTRRRETEASRVTGPLQPAARGWISSVCMHLAYRRLGARNAAGGDGNA
jgi:GT2 family glycosyltransferase